MNLQLKSSSIDRLRLASILDGISYVVLLGAALPLKYLAGMPMAVRIVGSIHGGFFIALCLCLLIVWVEKKFSLPWCAIVFACAIVPFAPFFLDRHLRRFRP